MASLLQPLIVDLIFYLKGLLAGFIVSIPFGPASIICIRRTLHQGLLPGLITAAGIIVADTLWGSISLLGLVSVAELLLEFFHKIRPFAAIALFAAGLFIFLRPPIRAAPSNEDSSIYQSTLTTFGITLVNPFIPLLFTAVLTNLGMDDFPNTKAEIFFLMGGILSGAILWWALLCGGLSLLHHRLKESSLAWGNKLSGLLFMGFSLYAAFHS